MRCGGVKLTCGLVRCPRRPGIRAIGQRQQSQRERAAGIFAALLTTAANQRPVKRGGTLAQFWLSEHRG